MTKQKELERCRAVVAVLNEALGLDRGAISCILGNKVPCNKALAEHPTIEVVAVPGDCFLTGGLGLINGIVRPSGSFKYSVGAILDEGSRLINEFVVYDNKAGRVIDDTKP